MRIIALTVHHNTNEWLEIQTTLLRKNIPNVKIWAVSNLPDEIHRFDKHWPADYFRRKPHPEVSKDHAIKLNGLTRKLAQSDAADDDIVIWIDSDAFPIQKLSLFLPFHLERTPFIAVTREENCGDKYPHPCFAFSTVGFIRNHEIDWRGTEQCILSTHPVVDTGTNLGKYLTLKNIPWTRLTKTKNLRDHPVFFAIYASVVYHHGAGSKRKHVRYDLRERNTKAEYNKTAERKVREQIRREYL